MKRIKINIIIILVNVVGGGKVWKTLKDVLVMMILRCKIWLINF